MINENTKLFILDNINKRDFLSEEFLSELNEVIDFYDALNIFFSGFELKDSSRFNLTGGYDKSNNKIYIFKKQVLIEFKEFLRICEQDNYDITRLNIFVIHLLIHELSHAYQKGLRHMTTNWDNLINDSLLTIDGKLVPNKLLNSVFISNKIKSKLVNKFYLKNHDIFPNELHAEGNALDITSELVKRLDNSYEYIDYVFYYTSLILSNYRIYKDNIISPLERFYKKIKFDMLYGEYDFSEFSSKELFLYGFTKDEDIINKELNSLFDTMNKDYVDIISSSNSNKLSYRQVLFQKPLKRG